VQKEYSAMPATSKSKIKTDIVTVIREEVSNEAKPFAALSADDLKKLKMDPQKAFDTSEERNCGVILTTIIPDHLYLSEIESEALYKVILANEGTISHSNGMTLSLRTKTGLPITMTFLGSANFIAVSAQFLSIDTNRFGKYEGKGAETKEEKQPIAPSKTSKTAPKSRGKKAAAPAPAPVPTQKRSTRASKKATPASVLEACRGSMGVNPSTLSIPLGTREGASWLLADASTLESLGELWNECNGDKRSGLE
jgi:hypothetical protein